MDTPVRRFERREADTAKFWEVALRDASITVRFGRLDAAGQTRTRTHPTPIAARAAYDKSIREKLAEGYVEVTTEDAGAPSRGVAEAERAGVPAVLTNPPWKHAVVVRAPRVAAAPPPSLDGERVAWAPGQREAFASRGTAPRVDAAPSPQTDARVLAALERAHRLEEDRSVDPAVLLALTPRAALRAWNEGPTTLWRAGTGGVFRLVARYELDALPGVLRYGALVPAEALEALAPVASPRVAPLVVDVIARAKAARPVAEAWLRAHPSCAIAGVLPIAIGPGGRAREAAEVALRLLASWGHADAVRAAASALGDEAREATDEVLSVAPPAEGADPRAPRLPPWCATASLPAVRLRAGGAALPASALEALAGLVATTPLAPPHPGVAEVRAACEPDDLARFAAALAGAWLAAGAPADDKWALHALGHFGDAEGARWLASRAAAWPAEGRHALAGAAVDALVAIGTDAALAALDALADETRFASLRERAAARLAEVAAARGLSPEELADRVAPDLGLGAPGAAALRVGPKRLDAALPPDARRVVSAQRARLERAMCDGRAWDPEPFARYVAGHPVVGALARTLVFAARGPDGALVASFRIAQGGAYLDADGREVPLAKGARVAIAHPAALGADAVSRWLAVIDPADQAFEQLARAVYVPTAYERAEASLYRFEGRTVATERMYALERRGWRHGDVLGGVATSYVRPLARDGLRLVLHLEPGVDLSGRASHPRQTFGRVLLQPEPGHRAPRRAVATFGDLDPVEFSELVRELGQLRS